MPVTISTRHLSGVASVIAVALAGVIAVRKYTQPRHRHRSKSSPQCGDGDAVSRQVYSHSSPSLWSIEYLRSWFGWTVRSDTRVVLRTANRQDAMLYLSQLTALQEEQKQFHCSFGLEVEDAAELLDVLVIEARIRRNGKRRRDRHETLTSSGMSMEAMESIFDAGVAAITATLSSLYDRKDSLVLCRIPLPDQRVYRDVPPVISRLIAAHADNRRLFPTYAEELLYYLPYLEQYRCQQRQHAHYSGAAASTMVNAASTTTRRAAAPTMTTTTMMTTTSTASTTTGPSAATVVVMQDDGKDMDMVVANASTIRVKEDACSIISLLGDFVDVNATMFSTSLFVDFGDVTTALRCDTGERNACFSMGEDQFIYDAIHEAFFHVVLRPPLAHPQVYPTDKLRMYPFKIWHMSRRSRRVAAELYVIDVAAAKGDPLICQTRVVDEVVAQAVLVHHRGSLVEFVEALHARFAKLYIPVHPTLRDSVERRCGSALRQRSPRSNHGWSGVDVHRAQGGETGEGNRYNNNNNNNNNNNTTEGSSTDGERESEGEQQEEEASEDSKGSSVTIREVLEELPHLREYILEHRFVFFNATLTAAGSNQLEEVFGVPATVFPFLPCARESVAFVTCVFDCIFSTYGPWNFSNFARYAHDVFERDRPEIVRHTPRIFRMLNKTRTGVISFEELCSWMARKLSSGMLLRPDAHLIAIAMSLRLPLALLMDKQQQWSRMECALASLSDADVEGY